MQWELGELGEQSISVDVDNKAKVRLKLRAERGQSGRAGTTNQSRRRFLRRLSNWAEPGGGQHTPTLALRRHLKSATNAAASAAAAAAVEVYLKV